MGIYESKLRFFTVEGELLPTPQAVAEQAQAVAVQAQQQQNQVQQQLAETEALLARYQERFGKLSE